MCPVIRQSIDRHHGVTVYHNGALKDLSHGRHYSDDGYYYGQKWQCVEWVKRYYDQGLGHRMPNVWGHARDYFDTRIAHGERNPQRDLQQYYNGGDEPPRVDDIVIFSDTTYGHVAIVVAVGRTELDVIQQNILGQPRQTFALQREADRFSITEPRIADGWLRIAAV